MAITLDQQGPEDSSVNDASSYATVSWTPGANKLILAWVESSVGSGAPNIPTLSGNGLTWVQVATITAATTRRITLFRAMDAAPSAGAVTIDFAGQTQTNCSWELYEFGGTAGTAANNGSEAIVQSPTGQASDTSITINTADYANSLNRGVAGFINNQAGTFVTPRTNWTELDDRSGVVYRAEIQWRSDATDTDASASGVSSQWGGIAVELAEVSTSGQTVAVGTASETDTALALGKKKQRTVAIATETDTALHIHNPRVAVQMATESDTALALTSVKRLTLGIATETETAMPLGRQKARVLGIVVESDVALPMTRRAEIPRITPPTTTTLTPPSTTTITPPSASNLTITPP